MKKKTGLKKLLIGISVAVLLAGAILYCNSYHAVLLLHGFGGTTEIVWDGNPSDSQYTRIVAQRDGDRYAKLGYLVRNKLGIWKLFETVEVEETGNAGNGVTLLAWSEIVGYRKFGQQGSWTQQTGLHFLLCGNNAVKYIGDLSLPENVTAYICQSDASYLIHFIDFGGGEYTYDGLIDSLLVEPGYIGPLS